MSDEKIIQLELKKLGLNGKEALVYLNLLEMGNVSVSQVAKKSGITRPTAYRILESLEKKGLIVSGKGSVWANSPDELLGLLRVEKRRVEEQEREFLRIIATLKSTHLSQKNSVNIFEGKKGMALALEEFLLTSSKKIKIIFSGDWESILNYSVFKEGYPKIKRRLGEISVEEIFAAKAPKAQADLAKRSVIDKKGKNLIIILCDKLFLIDKEKIVLISQREIIEALGLMAGLI